MSEEELLTMVRLAVCSKLKPYASSFQIAQAAIDAVRAWDLMNKRIEQNAQTHETARASGRTTRQILDAPRNAIYVCPNRSCQIYTRNLAYSLHRDDLTVVASHAANPRRFIKDPIVLDHACHALMSSVEWHDWNQVISMQKLQPAAMKAASIGDIMCVDDNITIPKGALIQLLLGYWLREPAKDTRSARTALVQMLDQWMINSKPMGLLHSRPWDERGWTP